MRSSSLSRKPALLAGDSRPAHRFPSWPIFDEADERRILTALRSGHWGKLSGKQVAEFERRFAAFHGARHAIGVVNGSVSLRLCLIAAGIKPGDEVIVPAYTFLASATAVAEANAIPIFADVELDTFNLCPKSVEAAITDRTRAIIVVHIAGQPAAMKAIMAIAAKHRLTVIEDAAHAHAAIYDGTPVGAIGHMGSFSFQSSKNLTSGEGGIITTNDDTFADACTSLHNCGRTKRGAWYEHHILGGNYRLGELQGALLNSQLDRLAEQTDRRDANGRYLTARLEQIPGLHAQRRTAETTRHAYHLFLFRIEEEIFGINRPTLLRALEAEGVAASAGYTLPLYRQPLFLLQNFGPFAPEARTRVDYGAVCCPNVEKLCYGAAGWFNQSHFLGTQTDMDAIVDAFARIYEHRDALRAWAAKQPKS